MRPHAMGIPTGMFCSLFSSRSRRNRNDGPDVLCLWLEFAKLAVCVLHEFGPICIFFVQYKVLKGDIARQAL